jgi:hypothetical protein
VKPGVREMVSKSVKWYDLDMRDASNAFLHFDDEQLLIEPLTTTRVCGVISK